MEKVSAVVVTWNSAQDISACLDSLHQQTYPIDKIIVVDNASKDGTPDLVIRKYPHIKILRLYNNVGFARANNMAINESSSEWILTLNPDARLSPSFTETLLKKALTNPKIGTLGGKLLRDGLKPEDSPIIDSAGIEIFQSRRVRDRGFSEVDDGRYDQQERVFGICAAAALYRREMLNDTIICGEYFAERFFAYYEDADLAWRAWRRGWEAWYVPEAVGWHKRGGSPVGSRFSRYLTHRNRLWMISRNESLSRSITAHHVMMAHELLMMLRMLRYPYLFKATAEALGGWISAIQERMQIKDTCTQNPPFQPGIGFS